MLPFFFRLKKLDHVIRFNTIPALIRSQSVAEHSFQVAVLALGVAVAESWEDAKVGQLLAKCLLHDLEEVEVSDIPHCVKHHDSSGSREFREFLKKLSEERMEMFLFSSLPETCRRVFQHLTLNAKGGGDTGDLVSFCDMYELLVHCLVELS